MLEIVIIILISKNKTSSQELCTTVLGADQSTTEIQSVLLFSILFTHSLPWMSNAS